MTDKIKLWFFRDLRDEQRIKLFSLFGLPVDEIGSNHGRQSIALKHIAQKLIEMIRDEASPSPESNVDGAELLATVKEFDRWHHLNELTIYTGGKPSDGEIDFEATAWNTIKRSLATTEGSDNG